jgi:hypothetical protein
MGVEKCLIWVKKPYCFRKIIGSNLSIASLGSFVDCKRHANCLIDLLT